MSDPRPSDSQIEFRIGLLCLVTTSIGWALNWPAMRVLLLQLPPLFARGVAGVTSGLGFALIALALGQSLRIPRHLIGRVVAAAALNVFAWMGLATIAMRSLNVAQCALLVYTMPIWATLLAWPLLGQRPSTRSLAGLVLAIAGLVVLFGGHALAFGPDQWVAGALSLAAAILFAFATVTLKPFAGFPPIALLAWQLTLGCVPMVVYGVAFEAPRLDRVTPVGWALMAYMTAVPMGLCYLTWFAALRRLPTSTASIPTLLVPILGVLSAAWMLGEPLGVREVVALLLVLGGVGLALRRGA